MAYAWTQDLPITPEIYDRIKAQLGEDPPDGLILHLVAKLPNGLRYIDVWESREQCERFLEDRVHPVLAKAFGMGGDSVPQEPPRNELEICDVWRGEPAETRA